MGKTFLFDNGFVAHASLAFNFSRGYPSVSPGGAPLGPDQPRYWHHNRLLCGCPTVQTVTPPSTGNFHIVAAGGVALDSTSPLLVHFAAELQRLNIYRNQIGSILHSKLIANPFTSGAVPIAKEGMLDLMRDEPGAGSDVAYAPGTYHVWHGMVVSVCSAYRPSGELGQTQDFTSLVWEPAGTNRFIVEHPSFTALSPNPEAFNLVYFDEFPGARFVIEPGYDRATNPTRLRLSLASGSATGARPQVHGHIIRWEPSSTALCVWQEGDGATSGWRVHWEAPNSQVGRDRGALFMSHGFRALDPGAERTIGWLPFCDYVRNRPGVFNRERSSNGGRCFLMRATRAGVGAQWTLHDVATPLELPPVVSPARKYALHAHGPYVERLGASGLRLVCPWGDVYEHNRVICCTIENENQYTSPQQWLCVDAHGSSAFDGQSTTGEGNQFVGSAPLGTPANPRGQIIGADECPLGILAADPPTTPGAKMNFRRLWGPSTASYLRPSPMFSAEYTYNAFFADCKDQAAGGPFAAQMGGGSQVAWGSRADIGRVLFSPNGELWAPCFANATPGTNPAVFFGDKIIIGSSSSQALGVRAISIPNTTAQRPLAIGCGGVNQLGEVQGPAAGTVASANIVSVFDQFGAEFPRPPCFGPAFRCTVPEGTGEHDLGVWRLTPDSSIPANAQIKARMWVYPLAWREGQQPISSGLALRLALGAFPSATNPQDTPQGMIARGREQFMMGSLPIVGDPVRGWYPITLDTDARTWYNEVLRVQQGPSAPFGLGLRIRSRNPSSGPGDAGEPPNPCDFLVAFDYVTSGPNFVEHLGVPPPVGPFAAGHEAASVSGMSCSSRWTVILAGEVPDDSWDVTDTRRPMDKVLCTLRDGNSWVRVRADVPGSRVGFALGATGSLSLLLAPPPQIFCFQRGSPVFLAIKRRGQEYTFFASVGGTVIAKALMRSSQGLRPTHICFGDELSARPEPMLWHGGLVDEVGAWSDAEIEASMRNLTFLSPSKLILPPGQTFEP